ncbi:MAG: DUF2782 domain-containing protein [Gammaproteobacteria bacterium]|nr:DUF2782 domain-containing protein [Rhodocyclaceae bacterium]MBU3907984.1 DUF2782 domain-containing protein [Gammaproteobacteria bacterium]MBU3990634.1 DUF2782 domain-containing protein [Gammaproteobacteria bacterium]MBU4006085.1 DUF2782 domain-containing protein [Gammaproteobacteria bacterium]MBU4022086.1 DUF2782 domain-containing protein [Gammaproteobacteria bacterium]
MRPHSFRLALLALLCAIVLPAAAQTRPPDLQPLPEPPPPPPGLADPALEPQVTITKRGEDKVEEFRMGGNLYMIKVTPPHGTPYYLIDPKGDGGFVRQDVGDKALSVPMWVIRTF